MSNHLIQPIELFGFDNVSLGLQCIKHGNTTPKWRTVSTLAEPGFWTALVGSENDDKWEKPDGGSSFEPAGIAFATSCLKQATLQFYIPEILSYGDFTPYAVDFHIAYLSLNDLVIVDPNEGGYVLASGLNIGDPAQTVNYIVDLVSLGLECRPCGNFWTIGWGWSGDTERQITETAGQMTLEIVDVTF